MNEDDVCYPWPSLSLHLSSLFLGRGVQEQRTVGVDLKVVGIRETVRGDPRSPSAVGLKPRRSCGADWRGMEYGIVAGCRGTR